MILYENFVETLNINPKRNDIVNCIFTKTMIKICWTIQKLLLWFSQTDHTKSHVSYFFEVHTNMFCQVLNTTTLQDSIES
jgi:hypothetical protein